MVGRTTVAVAGLCLLLHAHEVVGETRTVQVDCTRGESISKALEKKADQLIIEISGICEEDVNVRRPHVTLRGTDPLVDGIRAAVDEPLGQALNLFGAPLTVLENLKLTGGRVGLGINYSFGVDIVNCRVEGNEAAGIIVGTASGSNDLVDSVVTDNGNLEIWVANGSQLRCTGCTIQSITPFGTAAQVTGGSELRLASSTVAGWRGIHAFGGSRVLIDGGSTIDGWLRARGTVSMELRDVSITGVIDLRQGSTVVLDGVTQTFSGPNRVSGGSTLVARGATSLAGDLNLSEFSQAILPNGTSVSGSLSCSLGADVACDDPTTSVGGTSNCARCPKP